MKRVEWAQGVCLAGVARGDITPPVGIYHRMWGAATHDRSTGVHRPLTATALYLADLKDNGPAAIKVVVALDHCLLGAGEMDDLLGYVSQVAKVPRESIIVFFSHTHAAGLMGLGRRHLPGGDLIPAYLKKLAAKVASLVQRARDTRRRATIAFGAGRCDLATNRDYFDETHGRFVCGFNPLGEADDRVLVGRVTDDRGRSVATIVNYACHPTTLAWENTLISPDYVGAMRELVEQETGAACLFIQGASGDIGPRDGMVGDVNVADRNGRQLGYSVLSTLESIPAAAVSYEYAGAVVSGATLGIWQYVPLCAERTQWVATWQSRRFHIPLQYRTDLPKPEQLIREREEWHRCEQEARAAGDTLQARDARAMVERVTRRLSRIGRLPSGESFPMAVDLWRIGDSIWIALQGELYNFLQRQLRDRFPHTPMIVGTLANGSEASYLLDKDSYGKGLYQENVSLLAQGCLEILIESIAEKIAQMTPNTADVRWSG